jgi:hypothetical protein
VPKLRAAAVLTTTALVLVPAVAQAAPSTPPRAGAAGIGDPYFPLDGNGGYDVQHYDLDVRYDPRTNVLQGVATIEARATHSLSSFNLDFVRPLTVRSVTVERRAAEWSRVGGELTVVPRTALRNGSRFVVTVVYDGVPQTLQDELGASGFFHTDDGALAVGQPDVAATWFPSNDHPSDAASVSVSITVPAGVEGVSNGRLVGQTTRRGWTTWEWRAAEPMATYLVVLAIGQFELRQYSRPTGQPGGGRLRFVDALDPDLFEPDGEGASRGEIAEKALARQPEIIGFLEGFFGAYPFRSAGGIVDDEARLQFALETQTRPIYSGPSSTTSWPPSWSSCTSTPTCGSATTYDWPAGRTSGSTKASRPTPSGCGWRSRACRRPRRSSTSASRCRPTTPSGRCRSATPAPRRTSCSTRPCTSVAR